MFSAKCEGDEAETVLYQLFNTLRIKLQSVLFFIVVIQSPRKWKKRFQGVPGIRIILRRLMLLVTNGSSLSCSISTFFYLSGPNSIIRKEPKDVAVLGLKSPLLKGWFKLFNSLFLVKSMFWRIAGIGQRNWFRFVESVATIDFLT